MKFGIFKNSLADFENLHKFTACSDRIELKRIFVEKFKGFQTVFESFFRNHNWGSYLNLTKVESISTEFFPVDFKLVQNSGVNSSTFVLDAWQNERFTVVNLFICSGKRKSPPPVAPISDGARSGLLASVPPLARLPRQTGPPTHQVGTMGRAGQNATKQLERAGRRPNGIFVLKCALVNHWPVAN